jgi:hypothetical protein
MSKCVPVSLCAENPRYVVFRGEPTVLFSASEHYAAIMNRAFEYERYLRALHAEGFNHARVFTGVMREVPNLFSISGNHLGVEAEDAIMPWPRSDAPGAADGGNKFDVAKWNKEYFERLHGFFSLAGRLGIEIEFTLYGCFHIGAVGSILWDICPLCAKSNINGVGDIDGLEFHNLKHPQIVACQDRLTRKFVEELNGYGHFHFEICNEPYNDYIPDDWQQHVADVIVEAEKLLPNRHLVAVNVNNGYARLSRKMRHVDIYNFHYMLLQTIEDNYAFGKVIGINETGIFASKEYDYQAWELVLSGAGLYNMLDYSFTVGYEDGAFGYHDRQPGGGGRELRRKLGILKKFIDMFALEKMHPANELVKTAHVLNGTFCMLAEAGRQYAMFLKSNQPCGMLGRIQFEICAPAGSYALRIIETLSGRVLEERQVRHGGGLFGVDMRTDASTVSDYNRVFGTAVSLLALDR